MFSFLPRFIIMPITFVLFWLNVAIAGSLLFIGGIIKLLLPFKKIQPILLNVMNAIFRFWALNNYLIIVLFNRVEWKITGAEGLNKNAWYLLIANHQSWLDIMILANFARTRIPEPKFFLKDSLKKVPFIGMGCWALNMPFMKRYSREQIAKNPKLKGQDIETTKKSCQHFQHIPTTIINFVEGTRFTPEKQAKQGLTFQHLLMPKAAGIAFTLAAMENKFDKILNITLLYPKNRKQMMKDTLQGNLRRVEIHVEQIDVSAEIVGDYFNDENFKQQFQQWLNNLWKQKDKLISSVIKN
jgi:1-acyl-sn-glycerol-3-phosphate acyltransferase